MTDDPDVRIGTAEREQALTDLSQHLSDGRITLPEFDERSAAVSAATTRRDLDSVFADLPSALPAPTASRPLDVSKSSVPANQPDTAVVHDESRDWRKVVVGVMPLISLVLFFVVPIGMPWLFFLLVPLTAAVLFGGRSDERDK